MRLDTEALLKRTKGLEGGTYGQTLEQAIRLIKDPAAQHAICLHILSLVEGDVPAFLSLVPEKGVRWTKESYDAKTIRKRLSRTEVEKRALPAKRGGRPEFVGLFGDMSSSEPKNLQWGVYPVRGGIQVAANGAFAWVLLAKAKDGSYRISDIENSINND